MKIFTGTWNVNAREFEETKDSLSDWIVLPSNEIADIYSFGFQEIVTLNSKNVVMNGSESAERSDRWKQRSLAALAKFDVSFQLVMEVHMVGLLLLIFARDTLMPQISDIRSATVGVGILGIMGNKGGVCVRLSVYATTVCFVCAHLQANREAVLGRNSDYRNILERISFLPTETGMSDAFNSSSSNSNVSGRGGGVSESQRAPRAWAFADRCDALGILEHDVVFWCGDLNYRIQESMPTDRVFSWVREGHWAMLRDVDQLNVERKKGAVFAGFEEGIIAFAPTYKYIPGTAVYEDREEKKLRAPAWCDRVLWRVLHEGDSVQQQHYSCVSSLLLSDHLPVAACFAVRVQVPDFNREREMYQQQLHVLDKMDEEMSPKVSVDGLIIDFGVVKPMVSE